MTGSAVPVISSAAARIAGTVSSVPPSLQRGGDSPADHPVGGAVVEPEPLRQFLREVRRRGEMPGGLLSEDLGMHGQPGHYGGAEPDQPAAQVDRSGHLAVGVQPVVGPRRRGRPVASSPVSRPSSVPAPPRRTGSA